MTITKTIKKNAIDVELKFSIFCTFLTRPIQEKLIILKIRRLRYIRKILNYALIVQTI